MPKNSTQLFVRPTLLALAAAACVSAIAQENAQTMSEIVVSASGFEQELKQAPASITVVTREELERKSVRDLADALHGVEGIDVRGGQGKTGGFNISMRGMPSSFTLVLIDGRRTTPAGEITPNGFGDAYNAMIPPISAIERIEVIRGPMSTLYGSDAMGGVINIITRKVSSKWSGSASIEGSLPETQGEGSSQKTNFYLTGPIVQNTLGIAIRGGVMHRDSYDGKITGASTNGGHSPSKADTYNIGAKFTLTPSAGQQIWLDIDQQRATYDNRTSQLGNLDGILVNGTTYHGYGPELRFNQDKLSIGYEEKNRFGLFNTSISHRSTKTIGRTFSEDASNDIVGDLSLTGTPRLLEAQSTVIDGKLVSSIGEKHIITSGFQLAHDTSKDGISIRKNKPEFSQNTWALFAEDEWILHPGLALTTGLRYDHHDKFGGQFSPRAYIVWNASEIWTFKGGISRGFKAPRMNQLTEGVVGYTSQGVTPLIGNPNLTPETSTSTELGLLFDNQKGWSGGATLFHNDIKNIIATQTCAIAPINGCVPSAEYNYNADHGKTYGAEFSNKLILNNDFEIKFSYTWTDSQVVKNGKKEGRLSDVAKHLLLANANWKINQNWNTWLQAEYRAKARRANGVAGENNYFKNYSLFHAGVNYIISPKVSVGVSVNNLFNRNFRTKDAFNRDNYFIGGGRNAKGAGHDGRTIWLRTNLQF